jgi:FtsP/CotA-like multicopper oxidase with cupredoxin domain
MKRRDFVQFAGATLLGAGTARAADPPHLMAQATPGAQGAGANAGAAAGGAADYTLRIAPMAVEVAPSRFLSTVGYNGTCPGPILRLREGKQVTVDVINDSDTAELVHYHGLFLPPEIDGAEEEGSVPVPPGGRRRYQFIPRPAGTRWYHSHAMTMGDLHRGAYTAQFGFIVIEGASDPGRYDQEIFLALREWEPFYTDQFIDMDEQMTPGPQPEKPKVLDARPNGLEVTSQLFSINDKALGAGAPIQVRAGTRALARILNAGGLETRTIALSGHEFQVVALDGNPVPTPKAVKVLTIAPGERVDAIIEFNNPGVWILGSTDDDTRNDGMGVVVEYAGQHSQPKWVPPPAGEFWDYTVFGKGSPGPAPPHLIEMIFEKIPGGAGRFNQFTINGKAYPHDREFVLQQGQKHRLLFRNRTDDGHPLHLHRHLFELVDINGRPTAGIMKDTVIVPMYGRVTVDLMADQPGLSLFHCHIQQHMDFGFKALFRYG